MLVAVTEENFLKNIFKVEKYTSGIMLALTQSSIDEHTLKNYLKETLRVSDIQN